MEQNDVARFLFLFKKLSMTPDEVTWSEINELKSFSYEVSDFIEEEWKNY